MATQQTRVARAARCGASVVLLFIWMIVPLALTL